MTIGTNAEGWPARIVWMLAAGLLGLVGALVGAAPAQASDASRLAERFAPVVVVREQAEPCGEGEPYRPTTVETVLGQRGVVLRGPNGQQVQAPTAADIAGKGGGWYLDYPGNPLAPGCDYETWFRENSVGIEPTLYAHVATDPDHPDTLAVQYWFFYTYNDWNDKHEGDWEMVQVVLPASTVPEALGIQPVSVAYAQHEGSQVMAWDDPSLAKVGDRPVVYPGQGSHAAYYAQRRWFGKSSAAGFGCDNTTPPGLEVRPRIVLLPSGPPPTSGEFAWLSYRGHWGQQEASFNNGPTGPVTKAQWDAPITWMVEQGRTSAVSLPPVPGVALTGFCGLTSSGSLLFVDVMNRPVLVVGLLVVLVVVGVLLVRRTVWRQAHPESPDRERRAGQIVTGAFGWVRLHLGLVWGVSVALAATFVLAQLLNTALVPGPEPGDITGAGQRTGWLAGLLPAVLAVVVLAVLGWAAAVVIGLVRDQAEGRLQPVRAAMVAGAGERAGIVAAAMVLVASSVLTGSVVLVPVAAWVLAVFGPAPAVAVVEGKGFAASLRRSADLSRHHRWRTLAVQAMLLVVGTGFAGFVGAALLLVTTWPFWLTGLVALALLVLLLPVAFAGIALQYYDLRHRSVAQVDDGRAGAPAS